MSSTANEIGRFCAPAREEHEAGLIVTATTVQHGYVYFQDDPLWRVTAEAIVRAEARDLAARIASV